MTLLEELLQSGIDERRNIVAQLKRHIGRITNYFIARETTAKAEALNRNIQRFIHMNYGARNIDSFLYMLQIYFS